MASETYLGCYFFLLIFFLLFLFYLFSSETFVVIPWLSAAHTVFSFLYFTRSDLDTAKYVLITKVQTQQSSNISLKALSGHCKCSSLVNTVACCCTKYTKRPLFPEVRHNNIIVVSKLCNPRVTTSIVLVYWTRENVCNLEAKMYGLRKQKCWKYDTRMNQTLEKGSSSFEEKQSSMRENYLLWTWANKSADRAAGW